jgi:hypothetical protein
VVAAGSGHADHSQPLGGQLGRVAGQVPARAGVDELVPRHPDLASVVGVPVTLLVAGVDNHPTESGSCSCLDKPGTCPFVPSKMEPTVTLKFAEVPAPSPPQQPEPTPSTAPQPDPKGPETPDEPIQPEPQPPAPAEQLGR